MPHSRPLPCILCLIPKWGWETPCPCLPACLPFLPQFDIISIVEDPQTSGWRKGWGGFLLWWTGHTRWKGLPAWTLEENNGLGSEGITCL